MAKNQRLDATITIGSVLDKSIGKHFRLIRNGLDGVGDEIKQVTDRQKELSKQRRVLEKQGKSVDDLDREYEELGRTLDRLKRKQERFERAQRAANRVGREFGAATRNIGRFARNTSIVVGAASAAIFGLASSTAQLGDDVAKKADSLGIGIETFQELRFAAQRSGIEVSQFDSNMVAFTKRMGEAAQGSGPALDALDALGIKIGDIKDLAPEEQLAVIADRLKGIESPAERAAIMADLFSRSGVNMVNMLRHGSEELRTLMSDARATGFVLSEQAARDAEKFQDRLLETQLVAQGLKNTIGAALMPVVTDMMIDFGQFMRNNRDDVEAFAKNLANGLRDAVPVIGQVASGVADIGGTIATGIGKLAEFVGGWKNFGIILGGVMASKAVLSVGSLVWSVFRLGGAMWALLPGTGAAMAGLGSLTGVMKGKALGAAGKLRGGLALVTGAVKTLGRTLLLSPVGLAIGAIAVGAYLIRENWDDIAEWFGDLWGNVSDIFGGASDFIGGVWRGDMDAAADGLGTAWDGAKGVLGNVLDGIGGVFKATWSDLIKPVTDKLGVTDEIEAAWGGAKDRIGSAVEAIGNRFGGPLRQAFEGFGQYVSGAWAEDMNPAELEAAWKAREELMNKSLDRLKSGFKGLGAFVGDVFTGDFEGAAEKVGDAWDGTKAFLDRALEGMGSLFGEVWENSIKPVTDKLGVTDEIVSAWQTVKDGLEAILNWIGEKFDWVLEKISPVIDGIKWVRDKAGSIGGAIGDALPDFAAARDRDKGNFPGPPRDRATGKVQERAVGGTFAANIPLLVGEDGPELSYPSQGGFIAHNRALERMRSISADIVGRVRQLGDLAPGGGSAFAPIAAPARAPVRALGRERSRGPAGIGGRLAAASGVLATSLSALPVAAEAGGGVGTAIARALNQGREATAMAGDGAASTVERIIERVAQPAEQHRRSSTGASRQPVQITQTITINAPQGTGVEALVEELERRRRQAQNDALYDHPTDYGQYGEG